LAERSIGKGRFDWWIYWFSFVKSYGLIMKLSDKYNQKTCFSIAQQDINFVKDLGQGLLNKNNKRMSYN
jgi:hypothetical protein